jgi:hypothetical protein
MMAVVEPCEVPQDIGVVRKFSSCRVEHLLRPAQILGQLVQLCECDHPRHPLLARASRMYELFCEAHRMHMIASESVRLDEPFRGRDVVGVPAPNLLERNLSAAKVDDVM